MTDGYRRPYIMGNQPAAGAGASTGEFLGNLLGWYLSRGQRRREEALGKVHQVIQQAILTGNKSSVEELLIMEPEAIREYRKRAGATWLPDLPKEPLTLPPAPAIGEPGRPTAARRPAARKLTEKELEFELPWPTTPQGIEVRQFHEVREGRVPGPSPAERYVKGIEFLSKVDPELRDEITKAYPWPEEFGAPELESLVPEKVAEPQAKKWLSMLTIVFGLPTTPAAKKAIATRIGGEMFPGFPIPEFPEPPEAPQKMGWSTFLQYYNPTHEQADQFYKTGRIPTGTERKEQPAKDVQSWEYNLAIDMSKLLDTRMQDSLAAVKDPESALWKKYIPEKMKADQIRPIRDLLKVAYQQKNTKMMESLTKQLAALIGYPWQERMTILKRIGNLALDLLGQTSKYEPSDIYLGPVRMPETKEEFLKEEK